MNKTTGQTQHVFERTPKYRENGSPPMGFSPLDPRTFYLGTQYLLATYDKGMHWETVSPDLTAGGAAAGGGAAGGRGGGPAISALAFSPKGAGQIWAGTSNGLIQLTRDGGAHWSNVASSELEKAGAVAMIDASAADAGRAFVVIGGGRGGSASGPPHIYRTDDFGEHWKAANAGLPDSPAHAVREDPENRNLVFAALDSGVFVSFNGGDHWQPLQLNLPATSCRDLAIEQNTLVLATFGRALWALDDLSPLRELASNAAQVAASDAYLFAPAPAIRMQWDTYTDTPYNPDVASAENPPDGAIIDYYLKSAPEGEVRLEIYDSAGSLVRSYSSDGAPSLGYKVNVPDFWLAEPARAPKHAGLNRFVWDLRYPDPAQLLYTYFGIHVDYFEYTLADHAIPHNTPWHEPQGPMVVPGTYEVRLTAGGTTYRQPIEVKLDPRVEVSTQELRQQLELARKIAGAMKTTYDGYNQAAELRGELAALKPAPDGAKALEDKLKGVTDAAGPPPGFGPMNRDLTRLMIAVDQSDTPPASEVIETYGSMCQETKAVLARWNNLLTEDLPKVNAQLQQQSLRPLAAPKAPAEPDCR